MTKQSVCAIPKSFGQGPSELLGQFRRWWTKLCLSSNTFDSVCSTTKEIKPIRRVVREMLKSIFQMFLIVSSLVFVAPSAFSFDEDSQFWGAWVARGSLKDNWLGFFEYQTRYGQQGRQYERLLVRPAIGYMLSPQWQIHLGYAWTPTFQPRFNDENRYWQQSIYREDLGWSKLVWRNRLEQRLIQGTAGTSWRLREMLYLQFPMGSDSWRPATWDEVFLNVNEASSELRPGFEQNRFFLGLWVRVSERVTADIGYMNVYINRYSQDDRMLHNLVAYFFSDF